MTLRAAVPQATQAAAVPPPAVLQIELHDTLQPERARVFLHAMQRANQGGYAAVVVNLSTPGGLSASTDQMVAAIQQSRVPVIVWAGAPQTRVSGEGLRLLAAADLALMNSQAFLTPLWTDRVHGISQKEQGSESQRLLLDLERSSREHARGTSALNELTAGSHWFTGTEAVEAGLVDARAEKIEDVLQLASSVAMQHGSETVRLNLLGAHVEKTSVTLQEMLLLSLMNPDLCVLLLTLGLLLIYLEINTPGTVVTGAAGVLLVLLAGYALHQMPLTTGGIVLCLLAAALLLLEGQFQSHGVLASCGVLALVVGLAVLVNGPIPQLSVRWSAAAGAGLGCGGITASLIVLGMEARRAKVKTGADAMLGWLAVAQTALAPEGQILVRGELWRARLTGNDSSVAAGDRVKVLRADGSLLEVAAVPSGDAL
ncbi:MAG: NfeD family protein [Janthinobacterium lividum]